MPYLPGQSNLPLWSTYRQVCLYRWRLLLCVSTGDSCTRAGAQKIETEKIKIKEKKKKKRKRTIRQVYIFLAVDCSWLDLDADHNQSQSDIVLSVQALRYMFLQKNVSYLCSLPFLLVWKFELTEPTVALSYEDYPVHLHDTLVHRCILHASTHKNTGIVCIVQTTGFL